MNNQLIQWKEMNQIQPMSNQLIVKQESPAQKLANGEMQYAITLEMKYKVVNCK